jgi:hypothetical protein
LYSETAAFTLASLGWTAHSGAPHVDEAIVLIRDTVDHVKKDVVLVIGQEADEVARNLKDVDRLSFALDPHRQVVYFARTRGKVPSLHELLLATGEERLLIPGEQHGPSFSGLRVLGDGRLLFSSQTQNSDIVANTFGR